MQYVAIGNFVLKYPTPNIKGSFEEIKKGHTIQKEAIQELCLRHFSVEQIASSHSISAVRFKEGDDFMYLTLKNQDNNELFIKIIKNKDKELINNILQYAGEDWLELIHDSPSDMMFGFLNKNGTFHEKTLYLWSSGGGGHRSAKDALLEKESIAILNKMDQFLKANESDYVNFFDFKKQFSNIQQFIEWRRQLSLFQDADVLSDFLGKIGALCAAEWDEAQHAGGCGETRKACQHAMVIRLYFFYPYIY